MSKAAKELPRYKVQRQLEGSIKKGYTSLLFNMGKAIIAQTNKFIEHATVNVSGAAVNGSS